MDKVSTDEKAKLIQTMLENIRVRKVNKQYEILQAWDRGEITGTECIEFIENEMKVLRIESDLINKGKV